MLVPTAENDRFRFFRRGFVVDPCGRVGTRPYKAVVLRARGYAPLRGAGGRRRARRYAPLRGAAFRNVGAANFNPPAGRPQILNSPFSILNSAAGLGAELLPAPLLRRFPGCGLLFPDPYAILIPSFHDKHA